MYWFSKGLAGPGPRKSGGALHGRDTHAAACATDSPEILLAIFVPVRQKAVCRQPPAAYPFALPALLPLPRWQCRLQRNARTCLFPLPLL